MRETGTMLLAWAVTDDNRWIAFSPTGYTQLGVPQTGELWAFFQRRLRDHEGLLKAWKLPKALKPADVDAAMAGTPHVVLATEAANFLEGKPERVGQAHGWGVRHLQMVHYIQSPLGDHQTAERKHGGAFIDGAHDAADAAMVWSHSWISHHGGRWLDAGYLARSISEASAKKIAARGGVVGLWALRSGNPAYPVRSAKGFPDEVIRMCELLGPEHVAFGTDMEGVGTNPILSNYVDLRQVADDLARRGLDEAALRNVFIGNYARVVKQAMNGTRSNNG